MTAARLPQVATPWPALREQMEAMREHDLDWRRGRHGAYVWYANEDLEDVLREAFGMFMAENGLGLRSFPSINRMETEVLEIVQGLVSAPEGAAGIFSSGGTESIFLAMLAAREWARATKPGIEKPVIVAPYSGHPAVSKAAHILGMEVVRVPVGPDHRADVAAMEAAITDRTIALYSSAPTYSLGLIDPIPALSDLALKHELWLHVDACVGGMLAPAVRRLGFDVPSYDMANPGVSSISADLHKSGFAAKPASTVTFRSRELREFARYRMADWPSGTYSAYTFSGSRPGGAIAAAWAALHYLGEPGYDALAASSMRTRDAMIAGLTAIPGVHVHGKPDLWAFAIGADGLDFGRVAGSLVSEGWVFGVTVSPPGLHVMPTPVHEAVVDEFVAAVARGIEGAKNETAPVAAPRYN